MRFQFINMFTNVRYMRTNLRKSLRLMETTLLNLIFSKGARRFMDELGKVTAIFSPFHVTYPELYLVSSSFSELFSILASYLDFRYYRTRTQYNPHNHIGFSLDFLFRSDADDTKSREEIKKVWFYERTSKLYVQCEICDTAAFKKANKLYICEKCGNYLKMPSSARIELLIDPGTWTPMDSDLVAADPDPIEWDRIVPPEHEWDPVENDWVPDPDWVLNSDTGRWVWNPIIDLGWEWLSSSDLSEAEFEQLREWILNSDLAEHWEWLREWLPSSDSDSSETESDQKPENEKEQQMEPEKEKEQQMEPEKEKEQQMEPEKEKEQQMEPEKEKEQQMEPENDTEKDQKPKKRKITRKKKEKKSDPDQKKKKRKITRKKKKTEPKPIPEPEIEPEVEPKPIPEIEPADKPIPEIEPADKPIPEVEQPKEEDVPEDKPKEEDVPEDKPKEEDVPEDKPIPETEPEVEQPKEEDVPEDKPIPEVEQPKEEDVPEDKPIPEVEQPKEEDVPEDKPKEEDVPWIDWFPPNRIREWGNGSCNPEPEKDHINRYPSKPSKKWDPSEWKWDYGDWTWKPINKPIPEPEVEQPKEEDVPEDKPKEEDDRWRDWYPLPRPETEKEEDRWREWYPCPQPDWYQYPRPQPESEDEDENWESSDGEDDGYWESSDDEDDGDWEEQEDKTYQERLVKCERTTGLKEAVQTGTGKLNGIPVAIGVMEFQFIGGSMGCVVGEKITRLIEYATNQRLPLILVCSSGGARMQEGSLSLMQMAKIASVLYDYQVIKRLFLISILASPTTGGVTASFGMLGDIVIAEPYAYIAFAGKRVIEETLKIEVPEGSQVAELLYETGLLDEIVPRKILKGVLSELFQLHAFFPLNKTSQYKK